MDTSSNRTQLAVSVVVTAATGLVLCLGLTAINVSPAQNPVPSTSARDTLPPLPIVAEPVDSPEVIKEAYEFAGTHPEILRYVPCFCGICKRDGHHSNLDCFVKSQKSPDSRVVWESHAAECSVCLAVALEAKRLFSKGEDISSIRSSIEKDFASHYKHHTDTPEPPKQKDKK